jgi:hypothetical protein
MKKDFNKQINKADQERIQMDKNIQRESERQAGGKSQTP